MPQDNGHAHGPYIMAHGMGPRALAQKSPWPGPRPRRLWGQWPGPNPMGHDVWPMGHVLCPMACVPCPTCMPCGLCPMSRVLCPMSCVLCPVSCFPKSGTSHEPADTSWLTRTRRHEPADTNRLTHMALHGTARHAATLALSLIIGCLLYTSPSPRDRQKSRMPSSA